MQKNAIKSVAKVALAIFIICFILSACTKPTGYEHSYQFLNSDGSVKNVYLEEAITPSEQLVGLQNRYSMPQNAGMIFLLSEERPFILWMKDTKIPLDMIFFDKNYEVVFIYENAVPESLALIDSGRPVLGAVELNAGAASRLDIKIGSKIIKKQ